ncbi:hypothetical protein Bhyg_13204, partial [Pseudolycoriella hygida]
EFNEIAVDSRYDMLLTLYYIFQHWKLRSISLNLLSHPSDSITFYTFVDEGDATPIVPISSELCTNQSLARIRNLIWFTESQRGATINPKQNIHLAAWITFPSTSHIIPFTFTSNNDNFVDYNFNDYLLIETDLVPSTVGDKMITIEQFGRLIAWKVDSRLSVLLLTNENLFASLLANTFLNNAFQLNNNLSLTRVQTVTVTGTPQPFNSVEKILPKESRGHNSRSRFPKIHWDKHINELKKLSIFASQAAEFEYNKNKTEGKTGIVKPDLIPSTKESGNISQSRLSTNDSPNVSDLVQTATSPKVSPRTSPLKVISEVISKEQAPKPTLSSTKGSIAATDKEKPKSILSTTKKPIPVSDEQTPKPSLSSTKDPIAVTDKETPKSTKDSIPVSDEQTPKPTLSSTKDPTPVSNENPSTNEKERIRPKLVRNKGSLIKAKPPNILVYSDSVVSRDCVISALKDIVKENTYTIYPFIPQPPKAKVWMENTTLLVVCGYVSQELSDAFTEYFLNGGHMMSICSDLLHAILPTFRSHAEVREHELVQFSYGRWQKVKMMHHIFCYQPSPVKKHFSTDNEEHLVEQKKTDNFCIVSRNKRDDPNSVYDTQQIIDSVLKLLLKPTIHQFIRATVLCAPD